MKTNSQGSTHNIPHGDYNISLMIVCICSPVLLASHASTCSISYLHEYVMMSSITTNQPERMARIYSTAYTLSSTESKQRSQVNDTYLNLSAAGKSMFILSFISSLFLSLFPPLLTTARYRLDQCWLPWLLEGECVTWPGGSKSRRWPLLPAISLVYKENPPCEDTMGVLRRWVWIRG